MWRGTCSAVSGLFSHRAVCCLTSCSGAGPILCCALVAVRGARRAPLAIGRLVTMLRWEVAIVAVLYCNVLTCAAQGRGKALFPAAHRVKRGTTLMVNPTFQNSIEDVNLLFEILLAGLKIEDEHSSFSVRDEELASLSRTHTLEAICENVLPKRLSDIRRLTSDLAKHHGPLRKEDFERTVLTMVYTAYRLANSTSYQKEAWAESFVNLYRVLKQDLIGQ
ncbi:protein FAM180A-like [Megalops cyprinoides]|uniref:protein FAM180A-like n=1 Tax=Megalops cyprinoides TaxID=118141 RepID=UPI0018643637|nr:protein FAM180A-like [Megalops cyprinoides]